MGLDCSHDAWHGAYSAFHRWRCKLAEVAMLPRLENMEGFGGNIAWKPYSRNPLTMLLDHSDCDGQIEPEDCDPLADALEALVPYLPIEDDPGHIGNWQDKTMQFVKGLRAAAAANEPLLFR